MFLNDTNVKLILLNTQKSETTDLSLDGESR